MTLFHNQEELQKYDLLVPLDIPEKAGFVGKSSRGSIALNGEIGFSFNGWEASFHRLENHAYIIVRVNCDKHEIDEKLATVRFGLAWAGAKLDISMRPLSAPLVYLSIGGRADLAKISAFPAGEVPLASVKWSSYSIELPVSMLSEAIDNSAQIDVVHEALRIFADVDFEVSLTSRFITLSTILELMAGRSRRDDEAQTLFDNWVADAESHGREDLVNALNAMRVESIGSAIARMVEQAASNANCDDLQIAQLRKSARRAYQRRSSLLHEGMKVSVEELAALRSIVRLVLVGELKGTAFTPVGNKQWDFEK